MQRPDVVKSPSPSLFARQELLGTAKRAFQQFAAVLRNAALYPPAHPSLLSSAEQLVLTLEEILTTRDEAAFMIVSGELFFDTHSVLLEEGFSTVIDELVRKDIGSVVFHRDLARAEVVDFVYFLRGDHDLRAGSSLAALLQQKGVAHITVHGVMPLERRRQPGQDEGGTAPALYHEAIQAFKEVIHAVHIGKALNVHRMQAVVHAMVDGILDNRDAFLGLASIRLHDEYTFAHSVNVAILSIALGAFLGLEKNKIASLGVSGMLHDIGKVNIPRDIVNKPDALTAEEWEIMKRHPVEGAVMISAMSGISPLAVVAAFEHHIHCDSGGYPLAEGAFVHPFSRIVAIADAYDALTSARVYYELSEPPHEAARILLRKRGRVFEPLLVKAFINMVGIFPIGTLLRLNTGETGLVVRQTGDLMRPRALLLSTFDGTEMDEVSLLEMERGSYKRAIAGTVDANSINLDLKRYFA